MRETHGATKGKKHTREYISWYSMKTRCYNTNREDYKNYGGRGISVCDKWLDSFESFLNDMGFCPDGHSLDRINVEGDYEPSNCRWADRTTQCTNSRVRSDNKVGCKGVNWHSKERKWNARISVKGKRISLGSFKNLNDAIKARKEAEIKYWNK